MPEAEKCIACKNPISQCDCFTIKSTSQPKPRSHHSRWYKAEPSEPLADVKSHGTSGGYASGCRCGPCREGKSRYMIEYYNKNRQHFASRRKD